MIKISTKIEPVILEFLPHGAIMSIGDLLYFASDYPQGELNMKCILQGSVKKQHKYFLIYTKRIRLVGHNFPWNCDKHKFMLTPHQSIFLKLRLQGFVHFPHLHEGAPNNLTYQWSNLSSSFKLKQEYMYNHRSLFYLHLLNH